jgi:hypothetical protein
MKEKIFLLIILLLIFHSCNFTQKDLVVKLELDGSRNEEAVLVVRVKNNSGKNYYIFDFNSFTRISFYNREGADISDSIWNLYHSNLEEPKPPSQDVSLESSEEDLFISRATDMDLNFTQSWFHDTIPADHRERILDALTLKYGEVALLKAGELYEKQFHLHGIDMESIASIVLSYDNSNKSNTPEHSVYRLDRHEYIVRNFPWEQVDDYYLFRGKMEYKLETD